MSCRGASLVELMIGMLIGCVALLFIGTYFDSSRRAMLSGSANENVEANLRAGMRTLLDALRGQGYGVPGTALANWINWTGYTGNPTIVAGATASIPDAISVASCGGTPLATLATAAAAGATTLALSADMTASLDTASRSLLLLDETESLKVTSVSGTSITVDSDPTTAGAQGLSRAYPAGTPLCRVDVVTYDVDTANNMLRVNRHDGAGAQPLLDDIVNLKITPTTAGQPQYQITLTARSGAPDPLAAGPLQRSLSASIAPRN
jgi:Tfp pilus assembly protein PilW